MCEHLASFSMHSFWMQFVLGCIILKVGLGWLFCCLLLPNCSEVYKRFQAQFLHLAQSWWQRLIKFGWLPIQIFCSWANIWLQPRGKQLLESEVAVHGAGGFTAEETSLTWGAGGAYRILFTSVLVHLSLACSNLCVRARVKERRIEEQIRSRKPLEEEKACVLQRSCLLPESDLEQLQILWLPFKNGQEWWGSTGCRQWLLLHLNTACYVMWDELKCRQTFGAFLVCLFVLERRPFMSIMSICYRKPTSLGWMRPHLIYGAAHRRGQYWCSFRKQLESDILFPPMLHRDCGNKKHRGCAATRNKVLAPTWAEVGSSPNHGTH